MILESRGLRVDICEERAALRSIRYNGQEFLVEGHESLPLFRIDHIDERSLFHSIDSSSGEFTVQHMNGPESKGVQFRFERLGGLNLGAVVTIQVSQGGEVEWGIELANDAGIAIANLHFPWVVVRYDLGGTPQSECLLRPFWYGVLHRRIRPIDLEPDDLSVWRFHPENGDTSHYPGLIFAQFLAYYNDRAGLMVACDDMNGHVKQIKPVANPAGGIRLGFAHALGERPDGPKALGYRVRMQGFQGDWYDAADLYRDWVNGPEWNRTPLHSRDDLPAWMAESPLHLILRIQGAIDEGPSVPNPEFVPYEGAIGLLEKVADRLESPLLPILMSWEGPGHWVYPQSFPPAGGEESLKRFTQMARDRGWHVGTYCNGTRWVTRQKWSNYDGEKAFIEEGGLDSVCRSHEGEPWLERWDARWRTSYASCIAHELTRQHAVNYFQTLLDLGFDWIQFFDQNVGVAAFPCYSHEHGHPALPGRWMTDHMERLIEELIGAADQSGRAIVHSVEAAPNEYNLNSFHACDVRHTPAGNFVPLYHYLFHEYILTQAAFALAPNPHWMEVKTAHSFALGDNPSAILNPAGHIMNWEGYPWAPWDSPVGDQEAVLDLLNVTLRARREGARPYLVFGQMRRPAVVTGIGKVRWENGGKIVNLDSVFHSRWRAADGTIGIILANWTADESNLNVQDGQFPESVRVRLYSPAGDTEWEVNKTDGDSVEVQLPGRSVALLEYDPT